MESVGPAKWLNLALLPSGSLLSLITPLIERMDGGRLASHEAGGFRSWRIVIFRVDLSSFFVCVLLGSF